MREKRYTTFILALLLGAALLSGCAGAPAQPEPEPDAAAAAAPGPTPTPLPAPALSVADQSEHPALLRCDGSGRFFPERAVTRRELCRALWGALDGLPAGETEFPDYRPGNADYPCAAALYDAGLLPVSAAEPFRPDQDVVRSELVYILERAAERLTGEESLRAGALAAETRDGSLAGTGAGSAVTRRELAVVLERLAGRTPEETALFLGERLPADIGREDDGWAYIADAVTEGPIPPAEPGVHRACGWLYAVWEDGSLVKDMDYGVWTFGLDGAYTTGDAELDGYLAEALERSGADGLAGREALEAAYLYVKYSGEYLVTPEDMETEEVGAMGWEYRRALRFFRNGGGTCYGYAAAFGLMARLLGEEAYIVSAQVNQYYGPHAFVVIPEDGTDWIYDVELEATRQARHGDLDLFHIENFTVYNYWYEPDWREP